MPADRDTQPPDKPELSAESSKSAANEKGTPVLADVLEQVISATRSDRQHSAEDAALKSRLLKVAKQFPDDPLSVDPVLVSLVAAVTDGIRLLSAEQKRSVDLAVARSLFDDSRSHARLEQLWHSLTKESS
ncbi:hypothetical protein [Fuerstiella marisgermanici]|uniref:Uncharacterized protein n=1 Tax=Fuerstiella marisgermanici TaxID=1891926 RepID=A0A1P8WE31_9PLAN|nr:hypothetical protein [Fuerstiella marisgermanici]APZ92323.1 hypothetical protein Fuma_01933 [Fuerstiella marisgermanici]